MSIPPCRQWIEKRWPIWAASLLKAYMKLVRATVLGVEQTQRAPCAVAVWHGDEMALIPRFGHTGFTILISQSKDGEMLARGSLALGYRVTRGSSTRGAVGGLIALIRAVREGGSVVVAIDGPQGPREVCKPGVIRVVQKTGVPLFPVGVAVTHRFVFEKTWTRTYLPLPFSRQVVFVDQPIIFSETCGEEEMAHHCRQVEAAMKAARKKANRVLEGRA